MVNGRPAGAYVVGHWREPDHGIWESRGGQQRFVHSNAMMCKVTLDRAIKLASIVGASDEFSVWREERDAILDSVLSQGFVLSRLLPHSNDLRELVS